MAEISNAAQALNEVMRLDVEIRNAKAACVALAASVGRDARAAESSYRTKRILICLAAGLGGGYGLILLGSLMNSVLFSVLGYPCMLIGIVLAVTGRFKSDEGNHLDALVRGLEQSLR